jgi:hypothetical protein
MPANTAYRRVPTATGEPADAAAEKRRAALARSKSAENVSNKIHAAFWVLLAIVVMSSTDFLRVCFKSELVNRLYFNISLALITVNCTIGLYLCIYLPYIARVTLPWDKYCPRVIPTFTVITTVCGCTLLKALWPVWGFLTPLILTSVTLGGMFSLHFIPFL